MHRTLATVPLLATLAACGEPLLYEGEELDASTSAALTSATLRTIEVCNDRIDNDGDTYIDGADPDCKYASKTAATLGYGGTIMEGNDIHPGWTVYFELDGRKVAVEGRDGGVVLRDRYGIFAMVYTDSDVAWVGVGQRTDRYGFPARYEDFILVTEGGGAAYAPGQVGGVYDLPDPKGSTTSTGGDDGGSTGGTIYPGGETCTLSRC